MVDRIAEDERPSRMMSPSLSQSSYAALAGPGHDEMMAPDGSVRPHYRPLMEALSAMPSAERQSRVRSARQYLNEAGVFHRVYGEAGAEERDWPLAEPPLVLDPAEWEKLAAGLVERAGFLEHLLADIYGERRLVAEGILPAAVLGQNPEFVRPLADQARGGRPLVRFIAVDLGRGPDGRWWVLGDRTQAPSGAGFALENRVATSKAFGDISRTMNVERLAEFFRRFRDSLYALAGPDAARIGLLSPGPHNETYFEHAYLARYLGLLLLEGGDLVVEGDRVAVRTVDGLRPIDVIWRRLDSDFCDPLELFAGSRIGTPGLVRAVRAGSLDIVNALGSGILESRALMAFQEPLAEALIGRRLALPTIATWWCGQEAERRYVAANRDRLQLAPAFPPASPHREPESLRQSREPFAEIGALEGVGLVAQEIAQLSTAPVFVDGRLEPRPVALRVFLAHDEAGWHAMPGGFARVAYAAEARVVSMQEGGRSTDVWIPSGDAAAARPMTLLGSKQERYLRRLPGALPARAADNLYWLGRYGERCEVATRLLRLFSARAAEEVGTEELERRLVAILSGLGVAAGADPDRAAHGLLTLARQALDIASRIRDRFSPDGWRSLNEIVELILAAIADREDDLVGLASQVLTRLSGFTGLVRENMYQFTGWRFMQCGRRVERGQTSAQVAAALVEGEVPEGALEALLEFSDSRVTYRRRFSVDLSRDTVLDLTVLDPLNPRSVAFQVNSLADKLPTLPGVRSGETPDLMFRRTARLKVRLETADAEEVDAAFLKRVAGDLSLVSDLLTQRYLMAGPVRTDAGAASE